MGELSSTEVSSSENSISSSYLETPRKMLSRFYALQEERVQAYQMFEEGFCAYLSGVPHYNFPLYRQLVQEITEAFNKISQEILTIINRLSEYNNHVTVAKIIQKIQDAEKQKLELAAKFQLLRQKQQDEPSDTIDSEIEELKQQTKDNKDILIENMEELKYESEELYTDDEPDMVDSVLQADR